MKEHSGEESQEQRMRRHGMVLTWLISQRQQTARAPEVSRANITSCHLAFCHCKATVSSSWETLVASFRASWFPLTWWWTSPLQENKINWENDSLLNIAVKLWCFLGIIFCYLRLPLGWYSSRTTVHGLFMAPIFFCWLILVRTLYIGYILSVFSGVYASKDK